MIRLRADRDCGWALVMGVYPAGSAPALIDRRPVRGLERAQGRLRLAAMQSGLTRSRRVPPGEAAARRGEVRAVSEEAEPAMRRGEERRLQLEQCLRVGDRHGDGRLGDVRGVVPREELISCGAGMSSPVEQGSPARSCAMSGWVSWSHSP